MIQPTFIDRRVACKSIAASTAAGVLAPGLGSGASRNNGFRLNYILASAIYGTLPLSEVMAQVRQIGSDVIDIWRRPHANHWEQIGELGHKKFAELLEQHRVKLGVVTFWDGCYEPAIRFAHKFGAKIVVTGFVPEQDNPQPFLEKMKPYVDLAAELGVTLAIENHGASVDQILRFGEAAESPKLGVALAPYHLPQDEKQLASLIEDLGPKLAFFYAWQHGMGCSKKLPKEQELLQLPGRGMLDFAPLLAALRKINYQGWTEVFMHPAPRGIPILDTAHAVTAEVNRCQDYLEERLVLAEGRSRGGKVPRTLGKRFG